MFYTKKQFRTTEAQYFFIFYELNNLQVDTTVLSSLVRQKPAELLIVNIWGDRKGNAEPKQKCPESGSIAPCSCKERSSGLDITCEGATLDHLKEPVQLQYKQFKQQQLNQYVLWVNG